MGRRPVFVDGVESAPKPRARQRTPDPIASGVWYIPLPSLFPGFPQVPSLSEDVVICFPLPFAPNVYSRTSSTRRWGTWDGLTANRTVYLGRSRDSATSRKSTGRVYRGRYYSILISHTPYVGVSLLAEVNSSVVLRVVFSFPSSLSTLYAFCSPTIMSRGLSLIARPPSSPLTKARLPTFRRRERVRRHARLGHPPQLLRPLLVRPPGRGLDRQPDARQHQIR